MAFKIDNESFYTLKELYNVTGIPYVSVMKWCREKKMKCSKPGKNYLVKGEWFMNFIEKNIDKDENKIKKNK